MRDMAGGSYLRALASTFVPELLSMNFLMAGMLPTVMTLRNVPPGTTRHSELLVRNVDGAVGFVVAYPINWWLVANHLKHGMMTIRPVSTDAGTHGRTRQAAMSGMAHARPMSQISMDAGQALSAPLPVMALLSFLALAAGGGSACQEMQISRCPFRKFHPVQIRIVRQHHRIIESDVCDPARARNDCSRPSISENVIRKSLCTIPGSNSLFLRTNSLFLRKNSLFC